MMNFSIFISWVSVWIFVPNVYRASLVRADPIFYIYLSILYFYLYLYYIYISWNNFNSFSPRLGPLYSSRRSHLSSQRFDERECRPTKLIEGKCFHQNPNSFYTKYSSTHLLHSCITFLWHILYFRLHWYHCFMEEK